MPTVVVMPLVTGREVHCDQNCPEKAVSWPGCCKLRNVIEWEGTTMQRDERPDDAEPGIQISGATADGDVLPPCVDARQQDDEARAAVDAERAQADEDAVRAAINLMHSDEDE